MMVMAKPEDSFEILQLFLEKYKDLGLDLKAVDCEGRNALDYACYAIEMREEIRPTHEDEINSLLKS